MASVYHSHIDCEAYFSQEDKEFLAGAQADAALGWEHFAPEWRFLSKAPGPDRVRDSKHIMGIPGLSRALAFEVRRSNAVGKKARTRHTRGVRRRRR